ncbi:hypothetical protein C8R46DRAFT_1065713 [Mycena filopes]|nr:hypothetical protein C8R46DRAFT_1065713 [Mycena filopes]
MAIHRTSRQLCRRVRAIVLVVLVVLVRFLVVRRVLVWEGFAWHICAWDGGIRWPCSRKFALFGGGIHRRGSLLP